LLVINSSRCPLYACILTEESRHLVLVIPGLCGPSLDIPATGYLSAPLPALERLLSRAQVEAQPSVDLDYTLAAFFRVSGDDGAPLAVAPLTWLADTGERTTGFILRADPVHLRADQSCLRLFDSTTFVLDVQEARDLVNAFNDYYSPQGLRLHAPLPQRWYLTLNEVPDLAMVAPAQLAGRDISDGLPEGKTGAKWHAFLNEVQMLFHDHPVNLAREQRGDPAINSIWPWGGGYLPGQLTTPVGRVIADDPLLCGLARAAGIPCRDVPDNAVDLMAEWHGGLQLVWLDRLEHSWRYGEVEAWSDGIRQLEQTWFKPLLDLIMLGRIDCLDIDPAGDRRYRITRRHLRRFWKLDRSLDNHCGHV
jgi:hypothetical protein